jgi:hypothetical protein
MLNASSSILCRNLTTGASSTSEPRWTCRRRRRPRSPSVLVELEVVADDAVHACVALVAFASTILVSLSYSAMIQSTPIWVENLIFSAASWSDGSAVATISRLLRLASTTTR